MITEKLDKIVNDRHLLDHSFYQRWNCGELSREEMQVYAKEYFHYALAFPTFLSAAHANSDDITVRQEILENLIEEERGPGNHPELWLRFAEALGLTREEVLNHEPSEATKTLIRTLRECSFSSTAEGLAALYAYESQVPAVAQTKIDGLARYYGISNPRDIAFFTVHLKADVEHAETARKLLEDLCENDETASALETAVDQTTQALYGFLSDVEEQAKAA